MKFVALALCLLAVGSQASPMLSDAPSQLEHFRSALNIALDHVKGSLLNAVNTLDDAEHKDMKDRLTGRINNAYTQIKELQAHVAPITDSIVGTLSEATEEFHRSVAQDLQELEPMRTKVRMVIKEHIDQYHALLQPFFNDYIEQRKADMKALKEKFQPTFEELRKKVTHNVEETKQALIPLLKAASEKIAKHLKTAKDTLGPYVEEYKDQLRQAYDQAQKFDDKAVTDLREKINQPLEEVKTNLKKIYDTIIDTVTKDNSQN